MTGHQSNRRDFLRKTGIASTALVTGLSLPELAPSAAASSSGHKWSETTQDTDADQTTEKKLVQTTTLEWINGEWNPDAGWNGGWEHRYRVSTLFAGRKPNSETDPQPGLSRQQIAIKKKDYDALWTAQNQAHLTGVYPEFQNGEPAYSSLGPLFETAITQMSGWAEFAFQAAEAIDKMVNADKRTNNYDFHKDYDYYGSEYTDAHHYEEFRITNYKGGNSNNPDEGTHHYFQLIEMGSGAYGWVDTRQEWNMRAIKAQHPHKLSVNSSSVQSAAKTSDNTTVYQTDRGYTIEEIPPYLIPLRAKKIPVSPDRVEQAIENSDTLYVMRDGPIERVNTKEITGTGRNAPEQQTP